jgi:hypothetical protein
MPGLQLYQTESDEVSLINAAFDLGCQLVPDTHLRSPQVQKLLSIEAFQGARVETRHFYIFSDSLAQSPLSTRKVTKENGEFFYYVSPGVGTPSIEFLGGGIFEEPNAGAQLIRPGFLEFSREYWTLDLSRKLQSPTELESLFNRLSRTVKSHSSRIKPGKSVFWLGDNAQAEMEKGARLVGYESWSPAPNQSKSSRRPSAELAS